MQLAVKGCSQFSPSFHWWHTKTITMPLRAKRIVKFFSVNLSHSFCPEPRCRWAAKQRLAGSLQQAGGEAPGAAVTAAAVIAHGTNL